MADDSLYITPHEAALAVVATSMKKARLRLDTLIINSIAAGVLFSAGGMLALNAQAENPLLMEENPGLVHFMQGAMFPIGLFYVVILGTELFNSNILYFTVGVCRGAVSLVDLLISWSVTWLFNLGANLFVCYCVCHWSGVTQQQLYIQGSQQFAESKMTAAFMEQFVRGCAGNFCVCLAVYMQLLAKPVHVKFFLMALPIFTFVSMGFSHAVADMFVVPMGMFNGADISVGKYLWKSLIPVTLGNCFGGAVFSIVVPFYLHLVVVERDRAQLNLPTYEVKDEQPELQADSRVVRVVSNHGSSDDDDDDDDQEEKRENQGFDPVSYRPEELERVPTVNSRMSRRSSRLRSPPGVFPVMGMGKPLMREATIAGETNLVDVELDDDAQSSYSGSMSSAVDPRNSDGVSLRSTASKREVADIEREQEQHYVAQGGYNARENTMGETLRKVISNRRTREGDLEQDAGLRPVKSDFIPRGSMSSDRSSTLRMFKTLSRTMTPSSRGADSVRDISHSLHKFKITPAAANAADNIAGIDNFDLQDLELSKPQPTATRHNNNVRRQSSKSTVSRGSTSASKYEEDDIRESDEDRRSDDWKSVSVSTQGEEGDSGKTLA